MSLALYAETAGYYARGAEGLGRAGDFFTASDAGRGLGRCLARQLLEIDALLGPLDPFVLIEYGSGRGLLTADVLEALAPRTDLARRLSCLMVDRSPGMRAESARRVPRAAAVAPEEIKGGHDGCVLAVELFDALPVHRVRRRRGELVEVFVALDDDGLLVEREAAPGAAVERMARRYGAAAQDDTEAEVCPEAPAQLERMAATLRRGVLIVVDYGFRAAELYSAARPRGTLLAYHGHRTNEAFLERVGEQDLTAHVNFTALEDRAREIGLDVLGLTTQDRFLIGNGLLETFEPGEPSARHDPRRVKERLQALQLIHPCGMGRTFKVLLLSKGCDPPPSLSGMVDPFAY